MEDPMAWPVQKNHVSGDPQLDDLHGAAVVKEPASAATATPEVRAHRTGREPAHEHRRDVLHFRVVPEPLSRTQALLDSRVPERLESAPHVATRHQSPLGSACTAAAAAGPCLSLVRLLVGAGITRHGDVAGTGRGGGGHQLTRRRGGRLRPFPTPCRGPPGKAVDERHEGALAVARVEERRGALALGEVDERRHVAQHAVEVLDPLPMQPLGGSRQRTHRALVRHEPAHVRGEEPPSEVAAYHARVDELAAYIRHGGVGGQLRKVHADGAHQAERRPVHHARSAEDVHRHLHGGHLDAVRRELLLERAPALRVKRREPEEGDHLLARPEEAGRIVPVVTLKQVVGLADIDPPLPAVRHPRGPGLRAHHLARDRDGGVVRGQHRPEYQVARELHVNGRHAGLDVVVQVGEGHQRHVHHGGVVLPEAVEVETTPHQQLRPHPELVQVRLSPLPVALPCLRGRCGRGCSRRAALRLDIGPPERVGLHSSGGPPSGGEGS
mmetsp:Transcript_14077/g.30105  ORF Transcript_14077/g.30105 Transcript_14077/m.30105 type:complete len:497 (+) Transcript_14077:1268-2758(+)